MAQWLSICLPCRPPTNMARVRFPDLGHTWVEFVVGSCPFSERFFSVYSGFPISSKTNISKFQFDLESEGHKFSPGLLRATLVKQRLFYSILYICTMVMVGRSTMVLVGRICLNINAFRRR